MTVPGVVRRGVVHSAANIDKSWIGDDADTLLHRRPTGRDVHVVNDADAAGLAEVRYGAAKGRDGLVIVTTLGTGIGSALLVYDGVLVPNSELGHLEIDGHDAEKRAATSAREREELSWEEWAKRLTTYYRTLEKLFSPELFVVGGGVSKKAEKFLPLIEIETEIVPATLQEQRRDRRSRGDEPPGLTLGSFSKSTICTNLIDISLGIRRGDPRTTLPRPVLLAWSRGSGGHACGARESGSQRPCCRDVAGRRRPG